MKSSSHHAHGETSEKEGSHHEPHKKKLNIRVLICWLLILILLGFMLFCYTLEGFDLENMEKSLPVSPDEIENVVAYVQSLY